MLQQVNTKHMTKIFNTQDNIDLIIDICCTKAGISRELFMKKNREGKVIIARQVAIKILKDNVGLTYDRCGQVIGKKKYDHATIIHHHRRINELISVNDDKIVNLYKTVLEGIKDSVKIPNKIVLYIQDDETTLTKVTDFLNKQKKLYYEIK